MKTQIEKLNALDVEIDDFYCVTIYDDSIKLQGTYTPGKAQKYSLITDAKNTVDSNGYVVITGIPGIEITLT